MEKEKKTRVLSKGTLSADRGNQTLLNFTEKRLLSTETMNCTHHKTPDRRNQAVIIKT
jgi:hypothetical protein